MKELYKVSDTNARTETACLPPIIVFPDVVLSNSYLVLRPFFRLVSNPPSDDPLDPVNWEFGEKFSF